MTARFTRGSGGGSTDDDEDDDDDSQQSRSQSSTSPNRSATRDDRLDAPGGTDIGGSSSGNNRSSGSSGGSTSNTDNPGRSAGHDDRLDAPGGADTSQGDQKDRSNEPDKSAEADDRLEAPGGADTSGEANENAPNSSGSDGDSSSSEHTFTTDAENAPLNDPTLESGGDETLTEENVGSQNGRDEQFGDIDWSEKTGLDFAFGHSEEDEVENALRRGSEEYSRFVGGIAGGVTSALSSDTDNYAVSSDDLDADTERRLADISAKEDELGAMYEEFGVTNPREIENAGAKTAGATVRNLGEVGNVPSYAVTGIEAVEYGKYASSQDADKTVDETVAAADERGRQVLQYYAENPTEAAGAAAALAVSAPASSAGIKGLSRVSPRAGKAASAAADPVRTTLRKTKSARGQPDLDQPIPGTRSHDFGSDDSSLRETAGKFLRDERGMAQMPRRRGESETETSDEYGEKATQKLRDPEEDGVDIEQRAKEDVQKMVEETDRWKRTNVPPRNRGPLETDELTGELPPKKEFPSDEAYTREVERLRERQLKEKSTTETSTQTDSSTEADVDADAVKRDIDADTKSFTDDISGSRGSKGGGKTGAGVGAASNVVQTDALDRETTVDIGKTVETDVEATESDVTGTITTGIYGQQLSGRVMGDTDTKEVTREITPTGTETVTTTETTVETETETEIERALEQELAIETGARGRTGSGLLNPNGDGFADGGSGGSGTFDRQFNIDPASPDNIISGEALDFDDIDFEG